MTFWRKEFLSTEIEFVLEKIRAAREIDINGQVSLSGFSAFNSWMAFLVSACQIETTSDYFRKMIVQGTVFSPHLRVDFTEKDFRDVAYKVRHKLQNEDIKLFRVVFPVWNKPEFLNGRKRLSQEIGINLSPSYNTRYYQRIIDERHNQREHRHYRVLFPSNIVADLNKSSLCIVNVRSSSPHDANERAEVAVYELLGLVNLARDAGKGLRMSSRLEGKFPVSDVLIGPHTTTHCENGRLAHEGFSREDWVGGPRISRDSEESREIWANRYLFLSKSLARSRWKRECKAAASKYFKAFSNPNLKESFLDGWRLFESVTGSRYEKVGIQISRAANIFEDNLELGIVGKHLELRRNLISHGRPIRIQDEETLAFDMLTFILPFLESYILNHYSLRSVEELWAFLDLPNARTDRDVSKKEHLRKIKLLSKASEFRGETKNVRTAS